MFTAIKKYRSNFDHFGFLTLAIMVSGCAISPSQKVSPHIVYFESSYNDKNRAPASLTPPDTIKNDVIDPVYLGSQADYHFAAGEAFSYEGKHQNAIESFKLVLVYDPESSQVRTRLATEYLKLGLISESLEQAELAAKKDPSSTEVRLLLGALYSSLKVYDKAIKEYEQVLKLDPDNTEAPLYLGAIYAERKNYERSLNHFRALIANPEYKKPYLAWYYIGRVQSERSEKKYQKAAEEAYQKALSLKPDHEESALALNNLYRILGQTDKAIAMLNRYQIEQGPSETIAEVLYQHYIEEEKYTEALEQLAILEKTATDQLNIKVKIALILMEQKQYEPAIKKLNEILIEVPESDKIRFYLAAVYEELNQTDNAIVHFNKVQPQSQFFTEAVVHSTYLLRQQNKVSDALSVVKSALASREDVPQFYAVYSSLLDETGEYETALNILSKGIEKFPDNTQLHFFLGSTYDRLGMKDSVEKQMLRVLELDSQHTQALNFIAFHYVETNQKLDQAEKYARQAIALDPKDGYVMDTLGWILFKRNKITEAVQYLEMAHKAVPNEPIIAEHLGDVYLSQNLIEKARDLYQHAANHESDAKKLSEIRRKISSLENQKSLPKEISAEDHNGRKPASSR